MKFLDRVRPKRLETRLLISVCFALSLLSVVGSILTYGFVYRNELNRALALQNQLVSTIRAQAEVAVFAANTHIAEGVLEGLLASPSILGVRIDAPGGFSATKGELDSEHIAEHGKVYPLHSPIKKSESIGKLIVAPNTSVVAQVATRAAISQTALLILQVAIAAVMMAWFLRSMMIAPITRLAAQMKDIKPGAKERLAIQPEHANDELGLLTNGANSLLAAAEHAISEIESQRNELHIAEERLKFAIEGAGDGVWDRDMRTGAMVFSRGYREMLGIREDEQLDLSPMFRREIHPDDLDRFTDELNAYLAGTSPELAVEIRLRCADGGYKWILCRATVVSRDEQGQPLRMIGIHTDISKRKAVEAQLVEAREIAEMATKAKSDFLSNMSHEIRTPMNAIIGMAHLALQTELTPKQRNYIQKADAAAKNLLGIINDILDFSKIEAGKLEFERIDFDLNDVLDNLVNLAIVRAQEKGLELLFDIALDVPTALVGDPLRLGQVLLNFVSNAIKFTERGNIVVAVRRLEDDGENGQKLRFAVADTGVGLSPEQQAQLFKAFSQADASTTRKFGGTGLGLTIAKRLVEIMDGEVGLESELGRGSTFFFTARFGVSRQQTLIRVDSERIAASRILVVDDNSAAREVLTSMLAAAGIRASAVDSGIAAIEELRQAQEQSQPYTMVLMDWVMPLVDGMEAIRRIRSDTTLGSTPAVVMVTGHSRDEFLEQAKDMSIDGLLLKPVSPVALFSAIRQALGMEAGKSSREKEHRTEHGDASSKLRGARLLLVEDNAFNQEVALELLAAAGLQVDVAQDGAEAVEKVLGGQTYDGILMDCQMPIMDGFEATRRIRADSRFARLPIVAMTANAMQGDKERCFAAGMNGHIGKPIDVAQLFSTLAEWVTTRSAAASPLDDVPKSTAEPLLPEVRGLDVELALQRLGGNPALMHKLIRRFGATQSDVVARIDSAITAGDIDTARREAHTLRGSAGSIGATTLMNLAGALEHVFLVAADRRIIADAVADAVADLKAEHATVMANIRDVLASAENAPPPAAAANDFDLASEMKTIARLLADNDPAAGQNLKSLTAQLVDMGHAAAAANLENLISQYEFDDALASLQNLARTLNVEL